MVIHYFVLYRRRFTDANWAQIYDITKMPYKSWGCRRDVLLPKCDICSNQTVMELQDIEYQELKK